MDKHARMSMLIDFYGKLLTTRQYEIIDMYYNDDLSLGEISENIGISRQGVHDSLKRSAAVINSYESKLKLVDKFVNQKESILKVLNIIDTIDTNSINDRELKNKLNTIKNIFRTSYDNDNND